jgi:hypothetical protein
METAESFIDYLYKMKRDDREQFLMGLAKLKHDGATYTFIGKFLGEYNPSSISKHLKPYEKRYRELLDANFTKLEESLKRNDPDYDYITDPRTVTQQMCALLLGGEEMKQTLEQLCNLNLSTTPAPP